MSVVYNRIRGSELPSTITGPWSYTSYLYSTPRTGTVKHQVKVKYIKDVYERYGKGVWRFKPCESVQSVFEERPMTLTFHRTNGCSKSYPPYWWSGTINFALISPFIGKSIFKSDGTLDTSKVVQEVPADSWERLAGKLQNELPSLADGAPDFFVSIMEMADVLGTFDFIRAKRILAKVANGFLSYSFGVKPIIQDLISLHERLDTARIRTAELVNGAGKIHTSHVSLTVPLDSGYSEYNACPWGYSSNPVCNEHFFWLTRTSKATLGATVKYRYTLPHYVSPRLEKVMRHLATWNLIPSLQSYWEMVPYSFVIDWVVNTEKLFWFLRNFNDPHDLKVDIIDLCVTQKIVHNETYDAPALHCYKSSGFITRGTATYFKREVGENTLHSHLPWIKLPRSMQWLLGAALVWAKFDTEKVFMPYTE